MMHAFANRAAAALALRRLLSRLTHATLDRLALSQPDVAPEFFRMPMP